MTLEEMTLGMVEELVNKITAKVIEEINDTIEDKINDMLNDYDFNDNGTFTDNIRSEVEDLLSGASISL